MKQLLTIIEFCSKSLRAILILLLSQFRNIRKEIGFIIKMKMRFHIFRCQISEKRRDHQSMQMILIRV